MELIRNSAVNEERCRNSSSVRIVAWSYCIMIQIKLLLTTEFLASLLEEVEICAHCSSIRKKAQKEKVVLLVTV